MPIKNYTTKVPAVQTVGEIQGILAAHGARKVMMDYCRQGRCLRGIARSDGLQFRVRLRRTDP